MTKSIRFVIGLGTAMVLALAGTAQAQDAAPGEKVFKKSCSACHTVEPGKKRVGPSLFGVVGRTAGTEPGFAYSKANKESGIVWTEDKLDTYLSNPRALIKGTTMTFPGLSDPTERADLIAFLKTKQ